MVSNQQLWDVWADDRKSFSEANQKEEKFQVMFNKKSIITIENYARKINKWNRFAHTFNNRIRNVIVTMGTIFF